MFKGLKGGNRRSGGNVTASRVSSKQMGHMTPLASQNARRPAFLPDTPQEQGMDSDSSRLQGLEKNVRGGDH